MARLTRDEIVQNTEYQDRLDTVQNNVALKSLKGIESISYRSMQENRALIIRAVSQSEQPLSRTQICKKIKRAKAPAMINLIESLVADGQLERLHEQRPNGVVMYYYQIARRISDHWTE